eukprot:121639-Chlamydomonas_euryale.AAC.1
MQQHHHLHHCQHQVTENVKVQALQASDAMPHVSMVGCSLAPRAHHPPYYDPAYPNGTYVLDLAAPGERDTAARLVSDVWAPSGGASWAASHLNGQPFTLTPSMGWPGALPTIGVLRVDVVSARAVDPREVAPPGTATPDMPGGLRPHQQMSGHLLSCALSQLTSDAAGDEWRLGFVSLLTNVAHVTADQAAQLLGCFAYRKEKLVGTCLVQPAGSRRLRRAGKKRTGCWRLGLAGFRMAFPRLFPFLCA